MDRWGRAPGGGLEQGRGQVGGVGWGVGWRGGLEGCVGGVGWRGVVGGDGVEGAAGGGVHSGSWASSCVYSYILYHINI